MRRHLSGTSSEEIKCQFYIGPEPFWAWVCSVWKRSNAIKELMNCVLRPVGQITASGDDRSSHTVQNFLARAIRLYEQEPGEPFDSSRLGVYVQRWVRWAGTVVRETVVFNGRPWSILLEPGPVWGVGLLGRSVGRL